ncbi:T9SS type A sorting domain-containing protein [Flavobacterium sp. LPB0248]|uniref:T9SS type A sorting domain-containing protein n=1 Tax=Flavobacterium sp. LPB0248 TaxID=2614441 RepID=UPI0015A5BCA2|nr:T9SS type A sorting domain-containing protein [Flavobacterium sp. LPB0248]QLC65525.1 T9SS type A sorting domain-containing protein [Flavobacterium sp. LPB0248]
MKTKLLLFFILCIFIETSAQQKIYDLTSNPNSFLKFNGNLFFEASTENTSFEIWKSDGTPENTAILHAMNVSKGYNPKRILNTGSAILNGKLFFIARDNLSNGEIWRTDGINETVKITDFLNGRAEKLTTVGNSIFFLMKTSNYVLQIWKTDGTKEGTVLVKDNLPIWNKPTFEGELNNTFIFTFQVVNSNDSRVWRSDGTSEGTYPISDQMDGNGSGLGGTAAFTQYSKSANKLYFVSRNYLFETDGTPENTINRGNVWNGSFKLADFSDVIEVNGNLYFMFFSADYFNVEIWKFNLANKDLSMVYSAQKSQYFYPSSFVYKNDSLIFCGPNNANGTSLLSMKLSNNEISEIKEMPSRSKPFVFFAYEAAAFIYNINNNEYFITSPENEKQERSGYIFNYNLQKVENITALDNVSEAISYNDYLYYSKDNKLWKYASNLNVISIDKQPSLTLYPNPSTDFVQINLPNSESIQTVNIFDINGRLVTDLLTFHDNRIDVSRLAKGIYNVQIKYGNSLINKKIVKI